MLPITLKSTIITLGFIALCFMTTSLFSQTPREQLAFLEGTWKADGKDHYEVWKLTDSATLEGFAYKLKNGKKIVTESFSVKIEKDRIIYEANVPNQNNGKTIAFVWNKTIVDAWSFENKSHDFPKKIIYRKHSDTSIEVSVLGENDNGFNYRIIKQ